MFRDCNYCGCCALEGIVVAELQTLLCAMPWSIDILNTSGIRCKGNPSPLQRELTEPPCGWRGSICAWPSVYFWEGPCEEGAQHHVVHGLNRWVLPV